MPSRKEPSPRPPLVDARAEAVTSRSRPAAKLRLFQSRFRGRDDVFPKLWINETKGKKGYAPACRSEWVRGLCDKPRVRCGSCPNQAFIPVSDEVILDHLQGRHVIGTYPLLQGDSCWFLAIDFDKTSWPEDVGAFRQTCRRLAIPVLIERSRSGEGAHAWLFFAAPVAATAARNLGSYLLTETMNEHSALEMRSYDRMFPNQDTMPRGGFGNLIALPFQREARSHSNTIFIDDDLKPLKDQWATLAQYKRIEPQRVEKLAHRAAATGSVLGLPAPEDDDDCQPWERRPSGRIPLRITGAVPKIIGAVQRQGLFIERCGLPASLVTALKRLAAFQNPEFYKRQQLRLSVARTPRVISCAETHAEYLALPRGCLDAVKTLLAECKSELLVDDKRETGEGLTVDFHGDLSELQQKVSDTLLQHEDGILVAPPGIGKTVIGAYVIAKRAKSTLILVHRSQLLDPWVAQLSAFLRIPELAIGRLGAGKRCLNGQLDVATFQSLVRRDKVDDAVAGYGHVVVDECHHVSSASFERVLRAVRARYVLGLTATPKRRDGHHPITEMQLGPIRFEVAAKRDAQTRRFSRMVIARRSNIANPDNAAASIQSLYAHLASNEERNNLIVRDVVTALEAGRNPLVLTERRDHLKVLEARLRNHIDNIVVLHGGLSKRDRSDATSTLRALGDDEERVVLATGRFAGEGFDDPQLDTLFLALPIAWRGTLVQYAGRLHREHHAKHDVQVIDYVDAEVPVLKRMFEKRRRGYRSIGYTLEEGTRRERPALQLLLRDRRRGAPDATKSVPRPANNDEPPRPLPTSELDAMIDDVLIGAFNLHDQAIAFLEILDEQLELPFFAHAGKQRLVVEGLTVNAGNRVMANCSTTAGRKRRIPIMKLVPHAAPLGWEWAQAHNRWAALETNQQTASLQSAP